MSVNPDSSGDAALDRLIVEMRPRLHRYCARMTGSVIDGEDVLQDAIVKAIRARPDSRSIVTLEAWLFRVAHNTALDFLRRRSRQSALFSDEDPDMIGDPAASTDEQTSTVASLRTLMRLPVLQRSSVILKDVLGYSIQEIGGITEASIPSVKGALHRGRSRLRELAQEPEDAPAPRLPDAERARLGAYVERFNARDFDAVRDMLASDVRLELVNRLRIEGSEARLYFEGYAANHNWHFAAGWVDGRAGIVVRDPDDLAGKARYFILLEWDGDRVSGIRDFLFARYAMDGANVVVPSGY